MPILWHLIQKEKYKNLIMIDLNKDIIPLFPMGIYKGTLPNNFSSLVPFFDSLPMLVENDSEDYGCRSRNSYVLNLPQCKNLSQYILDKASEYAQEILNLKLGC